MAFNCISRTLVNTCRRSLFTSQSFPTNVLGVTLCKCEKLHTNSVSKIHKYLPAGARDVDCLHFWKSGTVAKYSSQTSPTPSQDDDMEKLASRLKSRLVEEPEETEPHEIYKGLLTDQMRRLKVFSLATSAMGIMMQPVMIQKASEVPLAANIAVFGMIGFFTIGTPLLIHSIARKYVTELVYDPRSETYTATTFTFFLQKKQIVFKLNDVKVPDVPGPFTSLTVKDADGKYRPYFVAPESFTKPVHYGKFMGYDKPINLHLSTVTNANSNDDTSSKSK